MLVLAKLCLCTRIYGWVVCVIVEGHCIKWFSSRSTGALSARMLRDAKSIASLDVIELK
jgi:hypothetical protein